MIQPTTTMIARVRENLEQVQARIAAAAKSAGRSPEEIRLVGVSKYVGSTETAALVAAGCQILGESRPQQLWDKASESFTHLDVDETQASQKSQSSQTDQSNQNIVAESHLPEWHLIGHLQRNKVDRTLPLVTLIHGVDSERLLKAINQRATENAPAKILLEVNCSGDADKHGFQPDELPQLIEKLDQYPEVQVTGLMTMAAREGGTSVARHNFSQLRELRDQLAGSLPENSQLDELSMGMSGDFEEAIHEGSTLVRVGSALWQGIL